MLSHSMAQSAISDKAFNTDRDTEMKQEYDLVVTLSNEYLGFLGDAEDESVRRHDRGSLTEA
jgi:hypothetical protein